MLDYLTYNSVSSADYHVYLSGTGTFDLPVRDISRVEIPGRNGDLFIDNGRYQNLQVEYPAIIMENFEENKREMAWAFSQRADYRRLEDTFLPDYFRMARFTGISKSKTNYLHDAGSFIMTFDCKPQLYLKEGEQPVTISGTDTLENPTIEEALPLIRITGTGAFSINDDVFELLENTSVVIVDSEAREVYEGTINRNDDFVRYNNELPKLYAGENTIICDNGISLEITPRWWTI